MTVPFRNVLEDDAPAAGEAPGALETLRAENAELHAEIGRLQTQVKTLVRTEGKLYRVQERLDLQIKIVTRLYELGLRINGTFDLEEILGQIPKFVLYELGYQRALVLLAERPGEPLRARASDGYYDDDEWEERLAALAVGAGHPLVERCLADRKVVHRDDAPTPALAAFGDEIGIHNFIAFPLFGQDALIGVLVAGNTLDEEEYHVAVDAQGEGESAYGLANLAGQTAAAINNALLYRALADERNLLEQKVHDRTQELSQAYENLEKLNNLKSQFFANVSHELRTPLTLSIAPLEEILNQKDEAAIKERLRHLPIIYNNQLRLLKLINDLLDISKIEAGRMTAAFRHEDVVATLKYYVGTLVPAMQSRGMSLVFEADAEALWLYLDEGKFEKIAMNLLSNAYKFTPDGGTISVRVREGAEHVEIEVADTGIGISPEALPTIFDRFSQGDASERREYEGTGIGLALVEEFTHLHGGEVHVASTLGEGTTFTLRFRKGCDHLDPATVSAADAAAEHRVDAVQLVQFQSVGDDAVEEPIEAPAAPVCDDDEAPVALCEMPTATVLVVDDLPEMRNFIAHLLRERYRVVTARDGREGLDRATALRPDVIVSDVMMPRMTGFDMLDALRAAGGALSRTPVILVSARADLGKRLEGLHHGADDYLVKPFNPNELLSRVQNLIRLRRQERELAVAFERLEERDARITEDLQQARDFQQSILPPLPPIDGVDIDVRYQPADLVGGDLYDLAVLEDRRLRIFIADVTGHGVKASLATMLVKSEFDRVKRQAADPAGALAAVNDVLAGGYGHLGLRFSAVCADFDPATGELRYATAAHPGPCLAGPDGVVELDAGGTFVGLMPGIPYPQHTVRLAPGDAVLFYTDGITEEWNDAGEEFGPERLVDALGETWRAGRPLADGVLEAVTRFAGAPRLDDDATAVSLRWLPAA
jgi:signal transduction histidine kinase/serine phosphatase RsbU (regulator of sigma subunit)